MKLAVIGDYESPSYQELLERVKIIFQGETIIDLSACKGSWKQKSDDRIDLIGLSHRVIICKEWDVLTDVKKDITAAQALGKECLIDIGGQFLPFPEYAKRW